MPLSIFLDALPYNEMKANYSDWFDNTQIAELLPNISYSSSLHWQLYCNKYPDERGVLVDWVRKTEKKRSVRFFSTVLAPLDYCGSLGALSKKFLDRVVYRRNVFANIPYRFRKDFSEQGKYLFWNEQTYNNEPIFKNYIVVSQDEGHISFEEFAARLDAAIDTDNNRIFAVSGFADSLGHRCRRGEVYSKRLKPYMDKMHELIQKYREKFPQDEVLIVSDHGMSTINQTIDLGLEKIFGKQSKKNYLAYSDSAVMCIWADDKEKQEKIREYLSTRNEGHLLTEKEREHYHATDRQFGDILYILREGNIFADNWFGKSMRKPSVDGSGMHGFWPEWQAHDQMASVVLINGKETLNSRYEYAEVNGLIGKIMSQE